MFAKMSLARRFRKEVELALQLDPNNLDANSDLLEYYLEAPGMAGGSTSRKPSKSPTAWSAPIPSADIF